VKTSQSYKTDDAPAVYYNFLFAANSYGRITIDDQSMDELTIIMRTMYLQYAQNLPNDIAGQVLDLNEKVLNWSVPHILSAVDHYNYYLNDISHMPVPLARSVSLSSAGTKSLPLNPFV
jgi:hypothetical protein